MTRAARFGGIQPDVYENLDYELGFELSRRLSEMAEAERKSDFEFRLAIAKAMINAIARQPIL